MEKMKLSPPWITYVHELNALFGQDPDIRVEFNDQTNTVALYVEKQEKADALVMLLPATKDFGNVTLNIKIVPANTTAGYASVLHKAFEGNPIMKQVITIPTPYGDMTYAMFRKEVVQFYNDQMDDPNGNKSTLYQDIAQDVLGDLVGTGTFFCTDTE